MSSCWQQSVFLHAILEHQSKEMDMSSSMDHSDSKDVSEGPEGVQTSNNESSKTQINIPEAVMQSISSMKPKDRDMKSIKRYLSSHHGIDVKANATAIKNFFTSALKSGELLKSEGKYKVAARRRKRSSGKRRGKAASAGRRRRKSPGGKRRRSRKSSGKKRRSRKRRSKKSGNPEEN